MYERGGNGAAFSGQGGSVNLRWVADLEENCGWVIVLVSGMYMLSDPTARDLSLVRIHSSCDLSLFCLVDLVKLDGEGSK